MYHKIYPSCLSYGFEKNASEKLYPAALGGFGMEKSAFSFRPVKRLINAAGKAVKNSTFGRTVGAIGNEAHLRIPGSSMTKQDFSNTVRNIDDLRALLVSPERVARINARTGGNLTLEQLGARVDRLTAGYRGRKNIQTGFEQNRPRFRNLAREDYVRQTVHNNSIKKFNQSRQDAQLQQKPTQPTNTTPPTNPNNQTTPPTNTPPTNTPTTPEAGAASGAASGATKVAPGTYTPGQMALGIGGGALGYNYLFGGSSQPIIVGPGYGYGYPRY